MATRGAVIRFAATLGVVALVALSAALAGCGASRSTDSTPGNRGGRHASALVRGASQERVPILMYHEIAQAPPGTAFPALWLTAAEFRTEIDTLAARGYHGVTLGQVWDAWHRDRRLPSKPIVFSFDDGYTSQYTNALPVLRSQRWPGVLNLEVATLHTTMRPWRVRALIHSGWEVDDHTMTHLIRREFHVPVNFFCYPAGRYDAHVIAAVKAAGYLAATTTREGVAAPSQPRYQLPRIRIDSGHSFPAAGC